MLNIQKWKLIWFFVFVILLQTVWLDSRVNKLIKQSPQYLAKIQNNKVEASLRSVAEPSINPEEIFNGKLKFDPPARNASSIPASNALRSNAGWADAGGVEASFSSEFTLKIMASNTGPLKKADLRIFYPKDTLQLKDSSWKTIKNDGIAYWSGEVNLQNNSMIKTITFVPLRKGKVFISFDFIKGSKLDSNLIGMDGKDVLGEVGNGTYIIK